MKHEELASKNSDMIVAVRALRRAARRALEIGLTTGTPVYVMKDGKITDLTQEESRSMHAAVPLAVRENRVRYRVSRKHRAPRKA